MDKVKLNTPCGEIVGLKTERCLEFRGIEYAKAGRWEYPVQTEHWDGVYDATEFGACSYQRRGFEDDERCNAFYHKEFRRGASFKYSEDCLFLNIWAPENAKNCPVLIYIHGGSFTGGSTDEPHLLGHSFAENGIVFASMNYRLGPYGFCSHPDLKTEEGLCGNFGLYDQYTAIKWIKENISAFGGDSENMTLFGQSAGAMSVDLQLSNPLIKGWFKGAILMSGGGIQRKIAKPALPEKTEEFWNKIISNAGCSNIEELRSVDEKKLFYAWSDACKEDIKSALYTLPVCDGKIVTKDGFNMKTIPEIPYFIGITTADMAPAALELITKSWVKSAKRDTCYAYTFARDLPGDDNGAWHACDLLYAFKTFGVSWRPFEEVDFKIANQLHNAICAFVKTGNPNCPEIPRWDTGLRKPMRFCESTAPASWQTGKLIKNTIFNRGPM